jgi:hypothetical protein
MNFTKEGLKKKRTGLYHTEMAEANSEADNLSMVTKVIESYDMYTRFTQIMKTGTV